VRQRTRAKRLTVEECLALNISDLARAGVFRTEPSIPCSIQWTDPSGKEIRRLPFRYLGANGDDLALRFVYIVAGEPSGAQVTVDETVKVTTTRCHFGGRRYWLMCPFVWNGIACRKRVRKLYLPPGAHHFGCRACYNLSYESAQTHDKRLDALLRLPPDEFGRVLTSDNLRHGLLALRAGAVLLRRLRKRAARNRLFRES